MASRMLDELTERLTMLKGITFGGAGVGTLGTYISRIVVETDLLTLLAYGSYVVSMTVGILTVITWFRKNKKEKMNRRNNKE